LLAEVISMPMIRPGIILEPVSKVPVVNHRQPGTAFGNRQEPFSLGGSNRSICPEAVILGASRKWRRQWESVLSARHRQSRQGVPVTIVEIFAHD
jgi:hypothetical protein